MLWRDHPRKHKQLVPVIAKILCTLPEILGPQSTPKTGPFHTSSQKLNEFSTVPHKPHILLWHLAFIAGWVRADLGVCRLSFYCASWFLCLFLLPLKIIVVQSNRQCDLKNSELFDLKNSERFAYLLCYSVTTGISYFLWDLIGNRDSETMKIEEHARWRAQEESRIL